MREDSWYSRSPTELTHYGYSSIEKGYNLMASPDERSQRLEFNLSRFKSQTTKACSGSAAQHLNALSHISTAS